MFSHLLWALLVGLSVAQNNSTTITPDDNTTTTASTDDNSTTMTPTTTGGSSSGSNTTESPTTTASSTNDTADTSASTTTATNSGTDTGSTTTAPASNTNTTIVTIEDGGEEVEVTLKMKMSGLCVENVTLDVLQHTVGVSMLTAFTMAEDTGIALFCEGVTKETKECICVGGQTMTPECSTVVPPTLTECAGLYKAAASGSGTNSTGRRRLSETGTEFSVPAKMVVKPGSAAAGKADSFASLSKDQFQSKLKAAAKKVVEALKSGKLPDGFPEMSSGPLSAAQITGDANAKFADFGTKYAAALDVAKTSAESATIVSFDNTGDTTSSTSGATGLIITGFAFLGSFLMI